MNYTMRTKQNSRKGVTLLFTISMIVLFLLMGTTFVVVANDYFKTANRRIRLNTNEVDTTALIERAFYEVFRGTDLNDGSSSLRGHGMLEDQYGYGYSGALTAVVDGPTASFKTLTFALSGLTSIHDGSAFPTASYIDGLFNGQVISIIGGQGNGYSTRIVNNYAVDITAPEIIQVVIPTDTVGIPWTAGPNSVSTDIAGGIPGADPVSIVINGRDFSGTGAGTVAAAGFLDRDGNTMVSSLTPALTPNYTGRDIYADFLQNPNSPNEDYDAVDLQNMFLSGLVYNPTTMAFDTIPSFHRDSLFLNQQGTTPTADEIRQFSFRPVYVSDGAMPPQPAAGSTANLSFDSKFETDGTLMVADRNDDANLEVDNNNDGENDSVWIDIGLPIQTDDQGRRFRPLVAYRIIDMDNRLNVNAHGSKADQELPGGSVRRGSSYGVAEVSLKGILSDAEYLSLLNSRAGVNDVDTMGSQIHIAGNLQNSFTTDQKLYGYVGRDETVGGVFSSTADPFGQFTTETPTPFTDNFFPAFTGPSSFSSAESAGSAYAADFSIGGGVGDSHFQAFEFERLLRPNDIDSLLATFRHDRDWDDNGIEDEDLHEIDYINDNPNEFTTDSFEISVPTSRLSIFELLRAKVGGDAVLARTLIETPGEEILPPEVLMGGKFNLNRPFGNGVDDDGDDFVDEADEIAMQTGQHEGLAFDLNNDGTINALDEGAAPRQAMARQLYTLALLVCGDDVPPQFGGAIGVFDYRRSVAQWAVNVVDFYDHDSKMTVFEYDANPFDDPTVDDATGVDGDPATPILDPAEGGVVIGVERPELMIMESMAFHSRENEDSSADASGNDVDGGDLTWDSRRKPISGAFFEIYNPWQQAPGSRRIENESLDPTGLGGIDLASTIGATPTWRLAVQRGRQTTDTVDPDIDDPDFIRTIYFTTPPTGAAHTALLSDDAGTPIDQFFPSAATTTVITPGGHMVIGGSGNIAGRDMTTFGRISSLDPEFTRSIELNGQVGNTGPEHPVIIRDWNGTAITASTVPSAACSAITIDMPRSLSLSDPTGDYDITGLGMWTADPEGDGQILNPALVLDEPLDGTAGTHRTSDDIDAIWSNGIYLGSGTGEYRFRIVHLQRLADPTLDWDEFTNPYVTIDTTNVDLLSYNGFSTNSTNGLISTGTTHVESYSGGVVTDQFTELSTVERAVNAPSPEEARRAFFSSGSRKNYTADTGGVTSDGHTFSYQLGENLGTMSDLYDTTTPLPLGWLVWNDRPFANTMEITHVPTGSPAKFLSRFNINRPATVPAMDSDKQELISYYMGDPQFGHLIGFGSNPPDAGGGPPMFVNRFDRLLDFIEVPNRFLGSEKFLPESVPAGGALMFGLNAPFNSIPTFRSPAKINLNTLSEENVWNAFEGGFTTLSFVDDFLAERDRRDGTTGASDFAGIFRSVSGAEFSSDPTASKGATSLYRIPDAGGPAMFDIASPGGANDTDSASYFKNEFRQRMAATTTTRSSVFSIWITIGYFEVDEFGRVGAELGSDEGQVRRNRAFFMVDRSIPVACEPGKNHNVDNAVLVRTIIE